MYRSRRISGWRGARSTRIRADRRQRDAGRQETMPRAPERLLPAPEGNAAFFFPSREGWRVGHPAPRRCPRRRLGAPGRGRGGRWAGERLDLRVAVLDLAAPVALEIDGAPRDGDRVIAPHAGAVERRAVGADDRPVKDPMGVERRPDPGRLADHPGMGRGQLRRPELDDQGVPDARRVRPVDVAAARDVDAVKAPRHLLVAVVRDHLPPLPHAGIIPDLAPGGDASGGGSRAVEPRWVEDLHLVAVEDINAAVAEVLVGVRERRRPRRHRLPVQAPVLDRQPEGLPRLIRAVVRALLERGGAALRAPGGRPGAAVRRAGPVRGLGPLLAPRLPLWHLHPVVPRPGPPSPAARRSAARPALAPACAVGDRPPARARGPVCRAGRLPRQGPAGGLPGPFPISSPAAATRAIRRQT